MHQRQEKPRKLVGNLCDKLEQINGLTLIRKTEVGRKEASIDKNNKRMEAVESYDYI